MRFPSAPRDLCERSDPVPGISEYGASVHESLRDLTDNLVKFGVWIEVTDPSHPPRDM